mgnify:CR=1 FL=1
MGLAMSEESQSYEWLWTKLDSYLASRKLKQTKQRQLIIEAFLELGGHISAEDLHDYIRKLGKNIGLATIYRTLNLLKEAQVVNQKQFSDGRAVYEVDPPGSHHDHLVCLKCNKVVEFQNDEIERLQEEVAKENGFVLASHSLDLFGYCEQCRQDGI